MVLRSIQSTWFAGRGSRGTSKQGSQPKSKRRAAARRAALSVESLEGRALLTSFAPCAANDVYWATQDQPLVVDAPASILANDSDVDGDALTAELFTGPAHGDLELAADGTFVYTPDPSFTGIDGFSYRASDGSSSSWLAAVSISVEPLNKTPVANNDSFITGEDGTLDIAGPGLLANDVDPDGDAMSVELANPPLHGTLELHADGSFSYVPDANFQGVDGFGYVVNDGETTSDVAAVTIEVIGANDGPFAVANSYSTLEDTPLAVDALTGVLANDADVEGSSLAASLISGPAHGSLTLNPDGSFEYIPEANFAGDDSFVYQSSDGELVSGETTVTIQVGAVNDGPTASADGYSMLEDGTLTVDALSGVLANDADVEGSTLAANLISGPTHGSLTLNPDGSFEYLPEANFAGDDSFVYQSSDGELVSGETTVTIQIGAVNDGPTASADGYSMLEDGTLTVDSLTGVLANDADVEGSTLAANLISGPAHGSLTLNPDGSFEYIPEANFAGDDSFVYQSSDGELLSGETTVTIQVGAVNDGPTASADGYSMLEDGTLTVDALTGVLANDADVEGSPLAANLISGPAHGSLTLNPDGSFEYIPEANFAGDDSFVYQSSDGELVSGETTVTIQVGAVNDGPTASADGYSMLEDGTLTVDALSGVLANDTDVEGSTLAANLISGPAHGSLTLNPDGSFEYIPEANFAGDDSFVYQSSDGEFVSGETTVTIQVGAVNDGPTASADGYSMLEDGTLTVDALSGVLANDTDVEGSPLAANLISGPTHGSLTLNPDGSFEYIPEANFAGDDSFVYQSTDGELVSGETTVTIQVGAVNDVPVVVNDRFDANGDESLVVDGAGVLGNDIDVDGDTLTAEVFSGPQHGTVELHSSGGFVYQPTTGFQGRDSFLYRASDGAAISLIGAVTIWVGPALTPIAPPTEIAPPVTDIVADPLPEDIALPVDETAPVEDMPAEEIPAEDTPTEESPADEPTSVSDLNQIVSEVVDELVQYRCRAGISDDLLDVIVMEWNGNGAMRPARHFRWWAS